MIKFSSSIKNSSIIFPNSWLFTFFSLEKNPLELSGGQKQRVAIARAIIKNPSVILADEPTGALDSKTSKEIMKILKDISKDYLVIMVTHNNELAKEYSDRIIKMSDGTIISDDIYVDVETINNKNIKNKKAIPFYNLLKTSFNNLRKKFIMEVIYECFNKKYLKRDVYIAFSDIKFDVLFGDELLGG